MASDVLSGSCLCGAVRRIVRSHGGAAVLVSNIRGLRDELEGNGAPISNWRVDERGGRKLQVFFVAAPDGLCYYFHEPLEAGA